ncbi:MAG TPA: hypothetical protein VJ827_12350 [Rubrobacter sp.]|nr:hypothetical protein [Rubrobacter sp.]
MLRYWRRPSVWSPRYGLKEAGRRIGLALDIIPTPRKEVLSAALEGRVVIRIILDQETGADSD